MNFTTVGKPTAHHSNTNKSKKAFYLTDPHSLVTAHGALCCDITYRKKIVTEN